jgi:hypothetical protein
VIPLTQSKQTKVTLQRLMREQRSTKVFSNASLSGDPLCKDSVDASRMVGREFREIISQPRYSGFLELLVYERTFCREKNRKRLFYAEKIDSYSMNCEHL